MRAIHRSYVTLNERRNVHSEASGLVRGEYVRTNVGPTFPRVDVCFSWERCRIRTAKWVFCCFMSKRALVVHSECDSVGLRLRLYNYLGTFYLISFCPLIRIRFIHKINVEWPLASRLLWAIEHARRDVSTRKVHLTSPASWRPTMLCCTCDSSPRVNTWRWRPSGDTRPLTEWCTVEVTAGIFTTLCCLYCCHWIAWPFHL